ncbi:MAG TPA: FadR/GntR family transcriptional regulator [Bacillales bacterium]
MSEQVVEQIEEWIESGQVKPGEKLPSVRELCDRFGVGRSAVRDAMTTLKGRGLVDVRQGEGAYVCRFDSSTLIQGIHLVDEKDISELFSVRKILEVGTAEMAARFRRPSDLENMKQAIDELRNTEEITGWEADYHFHLSIARATQNRMIVQLMETTASTIKKAMIDFHRIIFSDGDLTNKVFDQHFAVFEAIRNELPEDARRHMLAHLAFTEELLHEYLNDRSGFASTEG